MNVKVCCPLLPSAACFSQCMVSQGSQNPTHTASGTRGLGSLVSAMEGTALPLQGAAQAHRVLLEGQLRGSLQLFIHKKEETFSLEGKCSLYH